MNPQEPFTQPPAPLRVLRGDTLLHAGRSGPLWRVTAGAFRLERPAQDGETFVQLALAGDLMGVECLCAEPYAYTAVALTDSLVCLQPQGQDISRYKVMAQGFLQQQRRALDMMKLRSGSIAGRIGYLLGLLGHPPETPSPAQERRRLPSLAELARVVDSTPETVCRELKAFRPARPRLQTPVHGLPA